MTRLLLLLCLACGGPSSEDSAEPTTVPVEEGELEPVAVPSDLVPSVLHVSWAAEGTSWVEWGTSPDALDHRSPETSKSEISLVLLGLPAATEVHFKAVTQGETTRTSDVLTYQVPDSGGFPALSVTASEPGSVVADGYLLGALSTGLGAPDAVTRLGIWRASDGVPVWWFGLEDGMWTVSPSLSPYGPAVVFDAYPQAAVMQTAEGHRVALDGMSASVDVLDAGHHVAIETVPDTWAWIAAEFRDQGGRIDLSDRIYQAPFGATDTPVELFNEYDQVFAGSPPDTCFHNLLPTPLVPGGQTFDWAHTNSLVHVQQTDALFVHSRYLDALWKIDRASGTLMWQLGGPGSDFTAPGGASIWDSSDASTLWSHAHLSEAWEGGALAFDNGDHYAPRQSSIVEIAWDEAAFTAWEVWRYVPPDADFTAVLGDARRLPSDHVLISWTMDGRAQEIDRDGNTLWDAVAPQDLQLSRLRFIGDLDAVGSP